MKKLMIAAAIVCAAAFAQAGTAQWGSTYLNVYGQSGDEAEVVDGATVYLMGGTQQAFFDAVLADGFDVAVAGALNSAVQGVDALSNPATGLINAGGQVEFDVDAGTYTYFMVMNDAANNAFYISETATGAVPATGGQLFEFAHDAAYDGTVFNTSAGYQGAGYYQTEIIPEPTSGLLLILGVAGLALRRRRA